MANSTIYKLLLLALLVIPAASLSLAQQNFTYYSYPGDTIPPEGEPGIADTINFPLNAIIQDVNLYVGIDVFQNHSGQLIIGVISPWGDSVVLNDHNHLRDYLNCWFDTEDQEDGPGDLSNYVGFNAVGQWTMFVERYADHYPIMWNSWAIEVIGEPIAGIKSDNLPLQTGLNKTYPNPFNSSTIIHYSIANQADVAFRIYDVCGSLVKSYELKEMQPGNHQLKWDGKNDSGDAVASGIYFARMMVYEAKQEYVFTGKLTLLK